MKFAIDCLAKKARRHPTPGIELRIHAAPTVAYPNELVRLAGCHPRACLKAGTGLEWVDVRVLDTEPIEIDKGQHFVLELFLATPPDLLERFEAHRRGAPEQVVIDLDLRMTVTRCPFAQPREKTRMDRNLGYNLRLYNGHELSGYLIEIPRDEWLALLDGIGFSDVIVIELAHRRAAAPTPALLRARDALDAARRAYDENRTANVMDEVHRALEHLGLERGNERTFDRIVNEYLADEPEIVRERMLGALVGFSRVIHLGRHAGLVGAERALEVSRPHAAFALGVASLLFGWCHAKRAHRSA
jgi:hypothetical protein